MARFVSGQCLNTSAHVFWLQSRALDTGRMAALALRVAATAQFMDTGGALGLLAVLERMLRLAYLLKACTTNWSCLAKICAAPGATEGI